VNRPWRLLAADDMGTPAILAAKREGHEETRKVLEIALDPYKDHPLVKQAMETPLPMW